MSHTTMNKQHVMKLHNSRYDVNFLTRDDIRHNFILFLGLLSVDGGSMNSKYQEQSTDIPQLCVLNKLSMLI